MEDFRPSTDRRTNRTASEFLFVARKHGRSFLEWSAEVRCSAEEQAGLVAKVFYTANTVSVRGPKKVKRASLPQTDVTDQV